MSTSLRIACVVVLLIVQGLAGCSPPNQPSPKPPPPPPPGGEALPPVTEPPSPPTPPVVSFVPFTDPRTGLTTTDVYDASNHRLSFNTTGQLVWADGRIFPGFAGSTENNFLVTDRRYGFEFLEVRFGTATGENLAYLLSMRDGGEPTGTLVDLGVGDGAIEVRATNIPPPGTYTLEGHVYRETGSGLVPVAGADVWLDSTHIGQVARGTDANGLYRLPGLYDGPARVYVFTEPGTTTIASRTEMVTINGDTRLDIIIGR